MTIGGGEYLTCWGDARVGQHLIKRKPASFVPRLLFGQKVGNARFIRYKNPQLTCSKSPGNCLRWSWG